MGGFARTAGRCLEPYLLCPQHPWADLGGRFRKVVSASRRPSGSIATLVSARKKGPGPIDPEAQRAGDAI